MILTNEEIEVLRLEKWANSKNESDFARAIECAVIAKLAQGVEMPEVSAGTLLAPGKGQVKVYTADQLRAYGSACRVKALKDAAVICLKQEEYGPLNESIEDCAKAIRALKGEAP